MKVCPKCSTENSDYDSLCQKCGAVLGKSTPSKVDPLDVLTGRAPLFASPANAEDADAVAPVSDAPQRMSGSGQRSYRQANRLFIDPSEELRASIGSSYVQNFLSGGHPSRSVGVLTQKRFYYRGKNYNTKSKFLWATEEEGVVSVEDISFTGFSHTSAVGLLIIGAVLALAGFICLVAVEGGIAKGVGVILMLIGALAFVRYYLSRDTLFVVEFPGGNFAFDTKWYPVSDIQDFQRQLHLIKEQLKEEKGR